MDVSCEELSFLLRHIHQQSINLFSASSTSAVPIRPDSATLSKSLSSLPTSLPQDASPISESISRILSEVVPAMMKSTSPTFYGFVTGGCTPAAMLADHLVTILDQDVMIHLPEDGIATFVEQCAVGMMCDLVGLRREEWLAGSTLTTGATGSNVVGLALGREYLLRDPTSGGKSVSDVGYLKACMNLGVTDGVKVISCMPHSSIGKAASILGIGREAVIDVPTSPEKPWEMDVEGLREILEENSKQNGSQARFIVVAQHGEVNTGKFSGNLKRVRELCDEYGAWLHVDAAFGLFARCLKGLLEETTEDGLTANWEDVYSWTEYLELADSITGDGHKLLNVPYECGLFFTRHAELLPKVFANVGAAYLPSTTDGIISPSNINIENSRRFRALPVYATLATYGFKGHQRMVADLILHARRISQLILSSPFSSHLELLSGPVEETYIVVLFRAKDEELNKQLKDKINATGRMWVSATSWQGKPAVRMAVANWRVDEHCLQVVREVLSEVCGVSL